MSLSIRPEAKRSDVLLPAQWGSQLAGGVNVSLRSSINGVPDLSLGSVFETIEVPRPDDAVSGGVSWITANSTLQPLLAANTLYFLSMHICCGPVDEIFWPLNNAGIQGPVTNFFFPPATVATGTLGAFQLTGEPSPVPEPATVLLLATGTGLMARRFRRRSLRQEC